ncbi:hypothetical protein [Cytobacillus oceanisediminis]|uniref:hypothetical protein n=1 Tax=Cytobacillus oceanisediminis TaxID=665099 RepID=UPI0037352181
MPNNIDKQLETILNEMANVTKEGKRKRIDALVLEKEVKRRVGGLEAYRTAGGYEVFANAVLEFSKKKIITEMVTSGSNNRMPILKKSYWLIGKKVTDRIDIEKLVIEMGDLIVFPSDKVNKKQIQSQEWLKIKRIYQYLKKTGKQEEKIIREQRSLMLFADLDTGNIEPEKYLSSSRGKSLLRKLNLTLNDLNCVVIREPYQYWKKDSVPFKDIHDILIVEGLATFNTFRDILKKDTEWTFGERPQMLIYGSGKKILSSFEYGEELFENRTDMVFRYFGDLDPEGYMIYKDLKIRYEDYRICLDVDCYRFMITIGRDFEVKIATDQVMKKSILDEMIQELKNGIPDIEEYLKKLWNKKTRIAQEAMNPETLKKQKGVGNGAI